jgi:hypothetical protein
LPIVERQNSLHFIQYFVGLQNGSNHGLSAKSLRKFQIRSKLMEIILTKIFYFGLNFALLTAYGTYLMIAYILKDYNYYFVINLFWWSLSVYIITRIVSIIIINVFICYLIVYYLKLSFQQITEQFGKLSANNLKYLTGLMRSHDRMTKITKKCNTVLGKLMAMVYFHGTVVVNLTLLTIIYGNSNQYFKLVYEMLVIFTIISMCLVTYTASQVSTEAHRCYKSINSINVKNEIPTPIKLKVDFQTFNNKMK